MTVVNGQGGRPDAGTRYVAATRMVLDETGGLEQKAVQVASVKERLAKLGIEPLLMTQPEFERYFKADVLETDRLAKQAGIEKQ